MAHSQDVKPCWAEGLDISQAHGGLTRVSDRFRKSNPNECMFLDMPMGHFSKKPVPTSEADLARVENLDQDKWEGQSRNVGASCGIPQHQLLDCLVFVASHQCSELSLLRCEFLRHAESSKMYKTL